MQSNLNSKQTEVSENLDELLKNVTFSELKQFIRENVLNNESLRNAFFLSFSQYNSNVSKEFYANQLKSLLYREYDDYDFKSDFGSRSADALVNNLLDTARKHIEFNDYESAIDICTAIMEEMNKSLDFRDDSDGYIGADIENAYDMLFEIAEDSPTEEIRKQIFEYCIGALEKRVFWGSEWFLSILQMAANLIKNDEEAEIVLSHIDKIQDSEYTISEAQKIKYDILLETKGEDVAEEFLENNISNCKLRREALQIAINKQNYEKAIQIAQDGVDFDTKDKPGLAKEWYDWLLTIAQAQNDKIKIIEYARLLFIDNFRKNKDFYQILKQNVESDKWIPFIEEVVMDIINGSKWYNTDLIAGIYIKEEWWDRLLEIVKKNSDFYSIDRYQKYLAKDYSNEIVELYTNEIIKYMEINMGRKHYEKICGYIQKIINLGAREKATKIVEYLKKKYSNRRALIEELSHLK